VSALQLLYDRDRAMYYLPEDVPATSRTTTLNEELGQVGGNTQTIQKHSFI
jgi:hypothetical protein